MEKQTLRQLFESQKKSLIAKLETCSLPKDTQKVQSIITEYFNSLLDSEGEYRQSLTQSEDYILRAALSLLNAQQNMAEALIADIKFSPKPNTTPKSTINPASQSDCALMKKDVPVAVGGTAVGSVAGAFLFGTWGAVVGAIAGTAVALYYVSQQQLKAKKTVKPISLEVKPQAEPKENKINVELFLSITSKVCDSVDTLVATFRKQVGNVINKYESIEKPTFEGEYRDLLENIQALLGAYEISRDNENRGNRIDKRIEMLADSMENYDLTFVNYNGTNSAVFNMQYAENITEDTMVCPAIAKNEKVIIKGKVFTNKK